jgi:hypothetical protein
MKKFLILAAIFAALVALNALNQPEDEAEEKTVFSGEVAGISGSGATSDQSFKAPEEKAWKTYVDEKAGFRLAFPDSWDNFRLETNMVSGKDGSSKFKADFGGWKPSVHYLFSLFEESKTDYQRVLQESARDDKFTASYVGEAGKSGNAVLCFGACCQGGDGLPEFSSFESKRCAEVPDILKTFEPFE